MGDDGGGGGWGHRVVVDSGGGVEAGLLEDGGEGGEVWVCVCGDWV